MLHFNCYFLLWLWLILEVHFVLGIVENGVTWSEDYCHHRPLLDKTTAELAATTNLEMLMTSRERILLLRHLQRSRSYVEFGSGGSTLLAVSVAQLGSIVSIESDAVFWKQLMQQHSSIRDAVATGRIVVNVVDIGPVKSFGYPVVSPYNDGSGFSSRVVVEDTFASTLTDDLHRLRLWLQDTSYPLFSEYPTALLAYVDREIDLVLVDGRFRVASALLTLFATSALGRRVPRLLFHDFFNRLNDYGPVLRYWEVVDCVDNLAVLAATSDFDRQQLLSDLRHFVVDPQ